MKRFIGLFIASIVWTYGNEALDILAARGEWDRFQAQLGCEVKDEHVWCLVDNQWKTISNKPLPVPWGLD